MLVKRIIIMMSSAILMAIAMVLAITLWTAHKNNEHAANDSMLMVRGGFDALITNIENLNFDYSWWTDAMEASLARDVEWLSENMGAGANSVQFHLLEIFWPTNWSSLTWTAHRNQEGAGPLTEPIIPLETAQEIYERMRQIEIGEIDTQKFVHESNGKFYIVSATRIQPWGAEPPVPADQLPINFMAYELTEASLAKLASSFLINDLSLSTEMPTADTPYIMITGIDGQHIAHLEWTSPRPGDALMKTAALPISLGLILFMGLSGGVTLLAKRNAVELVVREKEASMAARTDVLTGLPNRLAFNESLSGFRKENIDLAILFMDMNGFKAINDEYGHEVGDKILQEIAMLALEYKRDEDVLARLGGDEFTVIFPGTNAEQACLEFCSNVMQRLGCSIKIDTLAFQPRIAMGYAVANCRHSSVSELMRQADYAMYTAKDGQEANPVKYDISLEEDELREMEIVQALQAALETGDEFSIAYQPIVCAETGKMDLAEALVRWNSSKLGAVPPGAFISLAEKTGMIVELGRQVMDMVFHHLKEMPDLHVSINLSPVQLSSKSILHDIERLAKKHDVDKSKVTFEVTESMLVDNPDLTSFLLDNLREQGFELALDDFGAGFSSIGYIRRFHFDKLKIDKSFVDDIGVVDNSENLMRAMVYLARSLDMKVVAEGVETEDQRKNLAMQEYDLLQGYLFSKPLPIEGLQDYIAASQSNFNGAQHLREAG